MVCVWCGYGVGMVWVCLVHGLGMVCVERNQLQAASTLFARAKETEMTVSEDICNNLANTPPDQRTVHQLMLELYSKSSEVLGSCNALEGLGSRDVLQALKK